MRLFTLGYYNFTLINIIDLVLLLVIFWQLFKRLKGSLAFNILIGLITIYLFWLLVKYFEMPLLEWFLGGFTQVGIIAVLVVFQQEIRKFLLLIGRNSFLGENRGWWSVFPWKWKIEAGFATKFDEIVEACVIFTENKTGATIIFPKTSEMKFIAASGETIDAVISKRLILSVFTKSSPLHDGAMIISKGKIKAANCILPVSDNPEMIQKYGLRHLSALGITEQTDAVCLVVSEEKGTINFVKEGKIESNLSAFQLVEKLNHEFSKQMIGI